MIRREKHMSIIRKEIELVGSKGQSREIALFDTGASYSFLDRELAINLETLLPLPRPLRFEMAKKGEVVHATERVTIDFYLEGHRLSDEFIVMPSLSERAIIGAYTLQKWRLKLDFEHDEVIVDPKVDRLIFI
jgi:predicted aspartyl protease